MDVLEKIFGGGHRVKIMRLFLFNPQTPFGVSEVASRAKVPLAKTKKEISDLKKTGMIKNKIFFKKVESGKKKARKKTKKIKGWVLNEKFHHLLPLQNLLVHIGDSQQREIVERIKRLGVVKLLIISGVFIGHWDSRVDILIVGDKLRRSATENLISQIEAEIGKEITYCVLETKDFLYRLDVYDKLVRDVLDCPHKKIINKLEVDLG